jgi:hypothetical protein
MEPDWPDLGAGDDLVPIKTRDGESRLAPDIKIPDSRVVQFHCADPFMRMKKTS